MTHRELLRIGFTCAGMSQDHRLTSVRKVKAFPASVRASMLSFTILPTASPLLLNASTLASAICSAGRARKATGCRRFPARAGGRSCASTGRWSRGSIRLGGPTTSCLCSDATGRGDEDEDVWACHALSDHSARLRAGARAAGSARRGRSRPPDDTAGQSNSDLAKKIQNPIGDLYSFPFQSNTNFDCAAEPTLGSTSARGAPARTMSQ
jgi:hypothetical protein